MSVSDPDELKEEGLKLFRRGAHDQALARFETAANAYAARENDFGKAEMLNNIGVIHRLRGNSEAAIAVLKDAEQIFTRLGEQNQRGQVLGNLGDLHAANRRQDEAARCYSDAVALFAQGGDEEKQGQILRALGLMRLRQGRWLEAMIRMNESLTVRPQISLLQRLFRSLLRFALRLLSIQ